MVQTKERNNSWATLGNLRFMEQSRKFSVTDLSTLKRSQVPLVAMLHLNSKEKAAKVDGLERQKLLGEKNWEGVTGLPSILCHI